MGFRGVETGLGIEASIPPTLLKLRWNRTCLEWQVLWCQTCLDCFRLGSSLMLHYRLGRSTPRDLFMTYSWIYEFIEGRQRLRLEKGVCAQSALYFIKKAPKWAAMRLKKADSPILKLQFTRKKIIQRVCRAPGLWGGAEGDTGLSSPGKVEAMKHWNIRDEIKRISNTRMREYEID